jgi:N-acetylglutamate synthase-like GNAT family acetyltransferase
MLSGELFMVRNPCETVQVTDILSHFGMGDWRGGMLAYRENGVILGCGAIIDEPFSKRHWLNCVAVRKGFHRRGIGGLILKEIISRLPLGHEIWLETLFWNRRFYEALAFEFIPIAAAKSELGGERRLRRNTMMMCFRSRTCTDQSQTDTGELRA